jgi:hypothetical protein
MTRRTSAPIVSNVLAGEAGGEFGKAPGVKRSEPHDPVVGEGRRRLKALRAWRRFDCLPQRFNLSERLR